MRKPFLFIILCFLIFSSLCSCARLRRLRPLMELGKSDKLKQRALEQETDNFQKVKAEIEQGRIKENISKPQALETFGEPVIIIYEVDREKWVYKEAKADWFGGEKIYLFFDKQGNLISWEYLNPE